MTEVADDAIMLLKSCIINSVCSVVVLVVSVIILPQMD
jgi:hypothetical protein